MPREQYKPKDKVVMRMTREGAVEDNLTEGTSEKISNRLEDAQLVKPHEPDATAHPEEPTKHKQPLPDDMKTEQQEQSSDQPQTEYKTEELPFSDSPSPSPISDS